MNDIFDQSHRSEKGGLNEAASFDPQEAFGIQIDPRRA